MNDYWVGVISGAAASLIFVIASFFIMDIRVKELQTQFDELRQQHEEQAVWIEENKYVMQTYKFLNESWAAIIKLQEERDE